MAGWLLNYWWPSPAQGFLVLSLRNSLSYFCGRSAAVKATNHQDSSACPHVLAGWQLACNSLPSSPVQSTAAGSCQHSRSQGLTGHSSLSERDSAGSHSPPVKLLLAFASTVILGSKSHGTHDHIYCLTTLGELQLFTLSWLTQIAAGLHQHSNSWYQTLSGPITTLLFPDFYMFWNEASFSVRAGVQLLLITPPLLTNCSSLTGLSWLTAKLLLVLTNKVILASISTGLMISYYPQALRALRQDVWWQSTRGTKQVQKRSNIGIICKQL
jgi:multisubunit Na+/H+ antiporter MnhG subunit